MKPLTVLQKTVIIVMRKADESAGKRRDYTATDLNYRGVEAPFHTIGIVLAGLIRKGLAVRTVLASAKGRRKSRYQLTDEGIKQANKELKDDRSLQ